MAESTKAAYITLILTNLQSRGATTQRMYINSIHKQIKEEAMFSPGITAEKAILLL
jgi:hypothetical protein